VEGLKDEVGSDEEDKAVNKVICVEEMDGVFVK